MNSTENRQSPHELVIVRRRTGGDGDGHHGGAWKIAFADFMTALMCFFLVMWLVNASDKQTITQIATYFNPIKLNDRFTSQKGLNDPDGKPAPKTVLDKGKAKSPPDEGAVANSIMKGVDLSIPRSDPRNGSIADEIELVRDPYGSIDRVAMSELGARGVQSTRPGATPGMPRDLFDIHTAPQASKPAMGSSTPQSERSPARTPEASVPELSAEQVENDLSNALASIRTQLKPRVEVSDTGAEVLISIIDDSEPGMFSIGSSKPTAVLIQVLDRVAQTLAGKGGAIAIRGHTDARQYSNGGFDNWRLSSARAQMAYYILVRSRIPAERVKRIEGHADRQLKVSIDPLAAQNRRIEILVSKGQS